MSVNRHVARFGIGALIIGAVGLGVLTHVGRVVFGAVLLAGFAYALGNLACDIFRRDA